MMLFSFFVSAGIRYDTFCFIGFVSFCIANASLRKFRIKNILSVSAIFYAIIHEQVYHNFLPAFASISNIFTSSAIGAMLFDARERCASVRSIMTELPRLSLTCGMALRRERKSRSCSKTPILE